MQGHNVPAVQALHDSLEQTPDLRGHRLRGSQFLRAYVLGPRDSYSGVVGRRRDIPPGCM